MKKNKTILALIAILCITVSVVSGCGGNDETVTTTASQTADEESTASTDKTTIPKEITTATTVYSDENYTYHSYVYQTEKETDSKGAEYTYKVTSTTEFVPVSIVTVPKTTKVQTTKPPLNSSTQKTEKENVASSQRNPVVSTQPVKEISEGISVLTKTTPVLAGNSVTITVCGTPGKTYSIEFYDEGSTPSVTSGLENKKANEEGIVSWTFSTSPLCSAGSKKIIVKENGSKNYLQTSITVN